MVDHRSERYEYDGEVMGMVVWFEIVFFLFFFQAEDGIRDTSVTGVQTCALPISPAQQE